MNIDDIDLEARAIVRWSDRETPGERRFATLDAAIAFALRGLDHRARSSCWIEIAGKRYEVEEAASLERRALSELGAPLVDAADPNAAEWHRLIGDFCAARTLEERIGAKEALDKFRRRHAPP